MSSMHNLIKSGANNGVQRAADILHYGSSMERDNLKRRGVNTLKRWRGGEYSSSMDRSYCHDRRATKITPSNNKVRRRLQQPNYASQTCDYSSEELEIIGSRRRKVARQRSPIHSPVSDHELDLT